MYSQSSDEMWMRYAITLASYAECCGEVAVGAVLVLNERVISVGWNSSITLCDPTAHAEMIALRRGGRVVRNYRLLNTTLYVTLEPCIMCFSAMVHARIFRLVFGAKDKKHGVLVSRENILGSCNFNHRIVCTGGVLQDLCARQIINFFYQRRLKSFL